MFKVGQDVICVDAKHSNHLANGKIYKVVEVCYGGTHLIVNRDGYTGEESTYSINRFEIAAGHRIDKPIESFDEFMDHCEKNNIVVNRDEFLKELRDFESLGDDSDIECHVSPLCKIEVK